jgi:hypothetical protein
VIRSRAAAAVALVSSLSACTDLDPTETPNPIAVVDEYEQRFQWDAPRECDILVHRRITDEDARSVEYHARVGQREMAALYSIGDPDSEYPVRVAVFDLAGRQPLGVTANDRDLLILGADGEPSVEVRHYDDTAAVSRVERIGPPIKDGYALHLLGCALPLRVEMGAVPAFLRNRASGGRLPEDPDVVADPETSPAILDWQGQGTILGALLLQASCTQPDNWKCPCLSWNDAIAGSVPGWCDSEPDRPAGNAVDSPGRYP